VRSHCGDDGGDDTGDGDGEDDVEGIVDGKVTWAGTLFGVLGAVAARFDSGLRCSTRSVKRCSTNACETSRPMKE